MPKSVNYIAQELSRTSVSIKKLLVLIEMEDGTFMSEDNGITVDDAEDMILGFRRWLRESNAKHHVDKKLRSGKKKEFSM